MTRTEGKLNVLCIIEPDERVLEQIRAVAPDRINVEHVWAEFKDEILLQWPTRMVDRVRHHTPQRTPEETDRLVREADIMLLNVPFPHTVPQRVGNLKWAHFQFAGISNIIPTDWGKKASFLVTSGRGRSGFSIPETAIGVVFMFAKRLDIATRNTAAGFDVKVQPAMKMVRGKTLGLVGLGGIGANLAELAHAIGMRVVATRRSAAERIENTDGVEMLYPPSELHSMLGESDFVVMCVAHTPETDQMMDDNAFAAMKPGAFFINVARGELVREEALVEALRSGHVAGAYLDVWTDEFGKPPIPELLACGNLVMTPHISGRNDLQDSSNRGLDLFLYNLRSFLAGAPMRNVYDPERGY